MRMKISVLRDDMDGTQADETVAFSLDGYNYKLDLSGKNAKKFRNLMRPYVEASVIRQFRRGWDNEIEGFAPDDAPAIRKWANEREPGSVLPNGRLPKGLREAYYAAQKADERTGQLNPVFEEGSK